jgi:radical SAM superfamily enzyme YgiQ (UPF0313 family)
MKKVAIIELGLYERMVPLVGGYLEAFAIQDPLIRSSYKFSKYSAVPKQENLRTFTREMIAVEADVYAFSCYVWNMRYVMRVLGDLLEFRPQARFILGGPQVMNQAPRYLKKDHNQVTVCNGEGEITFFEYLQQMESIRPDLAEVRGISFYEDGELHTTDNRTRLANLDEIPSPFLTGVFSNKYSTSVFETNRGCPFRCGFCYWGAATNDRVYKFSEQRIKDEITWISKAGIYFVYIADANWGMLPRDIAFTRHFVECKLNNRAPQMLCYAAAKNSPDRVTEINGIFRSANIITSQPIALQTVDDEALRMVDRQNIKTAAFVQVQKRLNELKISSFTELIWPLPGETLSTFRRGIERLCKIGTPSIIVYPHVLLVNTSMHKRADELGFSVMQLEDGIGEAEIVTATSTVSKQDCLDGMKYFYSVCLLHNLRSLRTVSAYLDRIGSLSFEALFSEFVRFWPKTHNCPLVRFVEQSIDSFSFFDQFNYGKLIHYALHENRSAFDKLVDDFVTSQPWFSDDHVKFLYEVDRIMKPYVYSSTSINTDPSSFSQLVVTADGPRSFVIAVPDRFRELFVEATSQNGTEGPVSGARYRVDHARAQHPHMKSQSLEHNAGYCYGMLIRTDTMIPQCTAMVDDSHLCN